MFQETVADPIVSDHPRDAERARFGPRRRRPYTRHRPRDNRRSVAGVRQSTPSKAPEQIGETLRVIRLEQHLSLEETAWRTRMRPGVLRALEEDEFDELGHPAHVRSHLASYARFLGADPSELVGRLDARRLEREPSSIEELDRRRRESRKPPRAKWLIAAAISASVVIAASALGLFGGQAERPAEPTAEVGAPIASAPPVSVEDEHGPVSPADARVRLRVEASTTTQVSILADGEELFEGELEAGDARTVRARDEVEIIVADGGAVTLTLNGSELGAPGEHGAVVRARFGPDGRLDD